MELLNKLKKIDSITQVQVGDIVCLKSWDSVSFYLFLGYNINLNIDQMLNTYFDTKPIDKEFECYIEDLLKEIEIDCVCYELGDFKTRRATDTLDYNPNIFNAPKLVDSYLQELLQEVLKGNVIDTLFKTTKQFLRPAEVLYRVPNVCQEETIKKYIIKLKLANIINRKSNIESYNYIVEKARANYNKNVRNAKILESSLTVAIKEQKKVEKPIRYEVYGKNVKDDIRFYVCLGYTFMNEPIYLLLFVENKNNVSINNFYNLTKRSWLNDAIKGKKLIVGFRDFYKIGVKAIEPNLGSLFYTNRMKLKELGLKDN